MAHLQIIEDENGDMIDYIVYCSDSCNRSSNPDYQGWYGCHEISTTQPCAACGQTVEGLDEG